MAISDDDSNASGRNFAELHPATRIICSTAALITALVIPLNSWVQALLLILMAAGWILWCRTPAAYLYRGLFLAFWMFTPLLLLIPLMHYENGVSWFNAEISMYKVILRGTASFMICVSSYSAMNPAELSEGLHSLPIPETVSTLILQIIHQSTMLINETRRILAVYRLRGITGCGFILRMQCLCAFPVLWLLRLAIKAEHTGNAMELRGFTGKTSGLSRPEKTKTPDLPVRITAFSVLIAAVIMKILLKH
ncbi:MAG: energy-coupling factor transporter transmembrane component T [Kiritimatiellia bacterium]